MASASLGSISWHRSTTTHTIIPLFWTCSNSNSFSYFVNALGPSIHYKHEKPKYSIFVLDKSGSNHKASVLRHLRSLRKIPFKFDCRVIHPQNTDLDHIRFSIDFSLEIRVCKVEKKP